MQVSFFSIKFLLFLIIVFVVNWGVSKEYRYAWLLISSYFFYATWNLEYTVLLLFVTLFSFLISYYIYVIRSEIKKKKIILLCSISFLISIMVFFKYWNFWSEGLCDLYGVVNPTASGIIGIIAPIGLSFYVLTAIGYMIDVYQLKSIPEKNFGKYALFLSFFPIILSGPIERSKNLLEQINNPKEFDYDKVKGGILRILYGFFMKLLVANRISSIVDAAFVNYTEQTGATMVFAVLLYGIQIYADFAGYTYIAIGIGKILGYELLENFRQPYFSLSIQDFWNRWHISLSSWLRDYVYIPLGGNRRGKIVQYVNLMITFLLSGVWHGTGMQFMLWGALHGGYQITSKILEPIKLFLQAKIKIKRDVFSYKLVQATITFILVDYAWLFFRAPSIGAGISITKNIIKNLQLGETLVNKLYLVGFDFNRFNILLIEIVVILVVDLLCEKKVSIISILNQQNKAFRWIVYIIVMLGLTLGVIRDYGVDASSFIYTRF